MEDVTKLEEKALDVIWPRAKIGKESLPIQLAQCWFPGLAILNAKI